ncbi:MAG: outer membrane beta-barrel protein, partial [Burkholderiales bacterium]
MIKQWLVAALGAVAMTLSAGALAQQTSGWYFGADLGQADFGSEDDVAVKVLGGYQITRTFGAEAGYGLLFDEGSTEVRALELVAVGSFPLTGQLSIFGKLGLANVDVETGGGSDDSTELTYGVGVQYDLSSKLGIRGQWQRYDTNQEIDL